MTITVKYRTGNRRRCSCCRETEDATEEFETEDEAIAECADIAWRHDFDFSVWEVAGVENPDDLERRIDEAVDAREAAEKRAKEITRLRGAINQDQAWIANMPAERARRQAYLDALPTEVEQRQLRIADNEKALAALENQ